MAQAVGTALVILLSYTGCCFAFREQDGTKNMGKLDPAAGCAEKAINNKGAQCVHDYKCRDYSNPLPAGVSAGLSKDHFYFTLGGYMCRESEAYIITNRHNVDISDHGVVPNTAMTQPSMSSADNGPKTTVVSNVKHNVLKHNEDYALVRVSRTVVGAQPEVLGRNSSHHVPIKGMLTVSEIQEEIGRGTDMYFSGRMAGWCGISLSNFEYVRAEDDFFCPYLYPGLAGCLKLKDSVDIDGASTAPDSNCAAYSDLCYPGNSGSLGYILKDGGAYAVAMLANEPKYFQPIVDIATAVGGEGWSMCEP
eukprot:TRINITY_DN3923_c0_g1_i2.p1 TRINITY_DN3923_c0_g1~~TRINITY_DN3923_c0_g1_i2.p1  ORF type:complete len:307 (-),score=44.78 TRINITY_DN3923_c0_g1_i2:128-1048(-)